MKLATFLFIFLYTQAFTAMLAQTSTPAPYCTTSAQCPTQTLGDTTQKATAKNTANQVTQAGNTSGSNDSTGSASLSAKQANSNGNASQAVGSTISPNLNNGATLTANPNATASNAGSSNDNKSSASLNAGTLTTKGGTGGAATAKTGNQAQKVTTGAVSTVVNVTGSPAGAGTLSQETNNYKSTFIPNMTPEVPFTPVAGSNLVYEVLPCGPYQKVVRDPVGILVADMFHTKVIENGVDEHLEPLYWEDGRVHDFDHRDLDDGREGYSMWGHQPILIMAVVGTSAGRSMSGGFTTSGQASAQAGIGGTSSSQQITTHIILRNCHYGDVVITHSEPPARVSDPPVVFDYIYPAPMPVPVVAPKKPIAHRRRKPCACSSKSTNDLPGMKGGSR